jgi:hypothetical protein
MDSCVWFGANQACGGLANIDCISQSKGKLVLFGLVKHLVIDLELLALRPMLVI